MKTYTDIRLEPMRESHLPDLAILTAKAFDADPGFNWIFFDKEQRFANNKWLWERMLWISLHHAENYVVLDGDRPIACVCPMYPSIEGDSLWTEIKAGLLKFPFVVPYESFRRAMISSKMNKIIREDIDEEYLFIEHVAVDVDYQGKGIGKRMIEQITAKADEHGLPCYLTTQNPNNLIFYPKCGFSVIKEIQVEDGPMIWLMKRPCPPDRVHKKNENTSL